MRFSIGWVIAAAVVLIAVIAGVVFWLRPAPPAEPRLVTRFEFELPKDQMLLSSGGLPILAVSPDGSKFVYSTMGGLCLRSAGELDARLIPGAGGISLVPFFSPDSKWICYWSSTEAQLKKISVSGGAPVTLTHSTYPGGSTWSKDDTIWYGQTGTDAAINIMRISPNGGTPELITKGEAGPNQILPDGKSMLCTLLPAP
jgi:Tol biopolymer transport system component